MKKTMFKSLALGIMLMASASANAQFNLGNLGKMVSSALGSDLASVITGKNNVTKETLVGTWSYKEPAVIFESSNLLKQAGGKVAAAAIEKKLSAQFTKVGITPGKFMVEFTSDGKFATYKNGQATTSGTYTLNGSKITFSYLEGTANVSGYAQFENNNLSLTFDSSKLLDVVGKVGNFSGNSTLGTVSSLAKSFDGMKSGLAFAKYVAPAPVTKATATKTTATKAKTTTKKSTKKRVTKKK